MNSEHSAVSEDPTHDELIGHGGLEDLTGLNDCDFGELIFQHGRETCGTPDDAEERIHKVSAEDRHHTHEVFRQYTPAQSVVPKLAERVNAHVLCPPRTTDRFTIRDFISGLVLN